MASIEDRLQHIEAQLAGLTPSLHQRLDRLEQAATPAAPAPRRGWRLVAGAAGRFVGWMGAELPKFLTAGILLGFGWGIKDSVDLSIKQRQLDLSYAKEMQGLLQEMSVKGAEKEKLEATAVVLASFGEPSLPSLLSELRSTGLRADAAQVGLSTLALTKPDAVCEALPRVLTNRAKQYDWQAHLIVVQLLGANRCITAAKPLQSYRQLVASAVTGNATAFEEIVSAPPLAPAEDYPRLLEAIDKSVRLLKQ